MDFLMSAYRDIKSSDDDSSSDSDSSEDLTPVATPVPPLGDDPVDGEASDSEEKSMEDRERERTFGRAQMLADLGIFDLPPIEDLAISVPEQECITIGKVHNIIDMLVIVAAKQGCPAIDLDSVLFLDHGKQMLGKVLDVFGPVSEPMYMVRFNSSQDIIDKDIHIGAEVFFAPRTKHTAYVFLDPLFHQKGSDASWENDQEPPEHCLDYSDDEQERKAKAALKNKKRSRPESNSDQGTNEHKKFQPRTQQNLRGRGRQRGAHHHHQRQPANPFYMSLSSNYSAGEYVLPTAAEMSRLVSNEGAAESTISNQPEILVQTDLTSANCENTTDIRPLNEPLSTSTCRSKSKDEAVSGEKSSVVDLESSSSGRENNAEPNRSIQYEPNDNANSSQNNQAEIKESCASDHQPV